MTALATAPARRRLLVPVAAIFALALAAWGVGRWRYAMTHESTDNAQVDGHIIPVIAKVGGYVSALSVNENDRVPQGAPLVQLDTTEYAVRLAQARADAAAARAATGGGGATGQAAAAVATASSQELASQDQIVAARANEARLLADLKRFEQLAAKQIASQQQLDAARAAAEGATATRQSLERQALAARSSVTGARAGLRAAEARLLAAEAALRNAQLQLAYTRIVAPESGTVSRRQVEIGQLVQAGQPVMSIVADTGLYVTANLKETQIEGLHAGSAASIEVDAYPGCAAAGTVSSIAAATGAKFALLPPDNATGNFTKVVQRVPVRLAITSGCGPDRPLRPGMSVTVHIETGR